jgi:hypothetical protein
MDLAAACVDVLGRLAGRGLKGAQKDNESNGPILDACRRVPPAGSAVGG